MLLPQSCPAAHHAFQEVVCDVHGTECIAFNVLADLLSSPAGQIVGSAELGKHALLLIIMQA